MPDVGGLVGVDRRVLDDGLGGDGPGRVCAWRQSIEQEAASFEEEVQIPVGSRGHARHAFQGAERPCELLRDRPWRLAQGSRQLERDRCAEVAEVAVRRVLQGDRRSIRLLEGVERGQQAHHVRAHAFMDGQNHRTSGLTPPGVVLRSCSSCGTLFTRWRVISECSGAGPRIVVWCVDVEKQAAITIEGCQFIRTELTHREIH